MKEHFEWILSNWNKYWGSGSYQYLLLCAVIFLIGWRRKKKGIRQVLFYLFCVLAVFACPLTAAVIRRCIGGDVYWRTLWLVPTVPVIALAGAELLGNQRPAFIRSGLVMLFVGAIAVCANSLLHSGEYVRVYNYQKVPNEVAHICNLVRENADDEEIRLAADDHVASYVRVYDPSILMPYGRRGQGALDWDSRYLYWEINNGEDLNYAYIAELAKKKDCDFISVAVPEDFDPYLMELSGYTQIGTVNQYGVFKLIN